jgi:two-component system, OmpR family, phosphate regulon sensor histidine kinase PhoR
VKITPDAKALLEHIRMPAMVIQNGRVSFANAAARELLGGHIVGDDVRIALRHPQAVALILSDIGGSVRVDGIDRPGSRWSLSCTLLADGTRLATLEDLSVRISVARAHADFVANASHELRTPLAAILGYVESLEDPRAGDDPATRARFLNIIRHEAKRMQALVEDLMALSRIEAGKYDLPTAPVDIIKLCQSCVSEAEPQGEAVFIAKTDAALVAGDAGQLAQALRNLIENGFKYGKPGGPVAVEVEVAQAGRLIISVTDEGQGIAAEHLPRVTERFYRADAARSRAVGGTGLGLSIVKHIVERHRGRFDISNKPGKGTAATIILPLLEQVP